MDIIRTMKILEKILRRRRQRGSKVQIIVAGILFLLLPLLAGLQYYWLGQLSEGERERLQASLHSAALHFSQDFNREITRIGLSFMVPPNLESDERPAALAEGYDRWRETTSYPSLIKTVFVSRPDDGGHLNLAQLKPGVKEFETIAWPDEMNGLRHQIEQHLAALHRPPEPPPELQPGAERIRRPHQMQLLNGDLPALIIPVMEFQPVREPRERAHVMPWGFAVIRLDLHCIQQEILPSLIQRHFAEGGHINYELIIADQSDPRQVVYHSGSQSSSSNQSKQGWDYGKDDASIGMFGLNIDEIRLSMRDKIRTWEFSHSMQLANVKRGGKNGPTGDPSQRPGYPPIPPPVVRMGFGFGEPKDMWELHIRHRTGSLETAVTHARWRNIFISSSILVVLGASMALLIISAQRARRLAQQQMDFVAGVSHELRTPIAVIDAAGYNIARGVTKNQEQVKKYGQLIRKETSRLKEIIEQILEFSEVQSGRERYDLLPANVNHVIEDVLASSQPLFDDGGFQVERNIAPNLPAVMADSQALSRAIQNLLNNAMKYSDESRWIGVRADAVAIGQGLCIRITVSDHGLGVSPEEQPYIFEPFYRGKGAKAAQIRGSGLGLSLVKNIIEGHGGSVSVQSNPGEGSSFTLTLPAAMPVGDQSPVTPATPATRQLKTDRMQPGIES